MTNTELNITLGSTKSPITLNKYVYGNSDSVNNIDPSGYLSLASFGAASAGFDALRLTGSPSSGIGWSGKAVRATAIVGPAGRLGKRFGQELARCYITRGKACVIPNFAVFGGNMYEATKHIQDAMNGKGSSRGQNNHKAPRLLRYEKGANSVRKWMESTPECGSNVGIANQTNLQCDEYPFAATTVGGKKAYYNRRVSLRLIKRSHNRASGGIWNGVGSQFRKKSGKKRNKSVLIVPTLTLPFSFYYVNGRFGPGSL